MATRHLRTCKICGTLLAPSSRPCDSPRPSHDLFTIFCIHVLSPLPRDRIRTNCLKCVPFRLFLWRMAYFISILFHPQVDFVRTACPRSEIVRLLGQCRAIDEQQVLRQSNEF